MLTATVRYTTCTIMSWRSASVRYTLNTMSSRSIKSYQLHPTCELQYLKTVRSGVLQSNRAPNPNDVYVYPNVAMKTIRSRTQSVHFAIKDTWSMGLRCSLLLYDRLLMPFHDAHHPPPFYIKLYTMKKKILPSALFRHIALLVHCTPNRRCLSKLNPSLSTI